MILATPLVPLIGAHRGASRDAPENTLAAFDLAIEQGAELIELDVHLTADGCAVVHHDFTMLRTAGCPSRIADLRLHALAQLDVGLWRGPGYGGQSVPTLDLVLERYGSRTFLNVEIKVGETPYAHIEERVAEAITERGLGDRVVVSTFDLETFLRLRRNYPAIRASLLVEAPSTPRVALSRDAYLKAALVIAAQHGAVGLHVDHALIGRKLVEQAAQAGLGILAWTVDDEREMRRLAHLGVEAILSNRPATLRRCVARLRANSGT